jgi:hypothetical protein
MTEGSGAESGSVPLSNGSGCAQKLTDHTDPEHCLLRLKIQRRLARLENAVLIPHVFLEGVDILEEAVTELALQQHGDGGVHVLDVAPQAVLVDPLQAVRTRGIPSCNKPVTSQTLRNR